MFVYRISALSKLVASGNTSRWNSKGKYVIYSSSNRALACLENIVHRSGEGLNIKFKILTIEIPDSIKKNEIKKFQSGWINNYQIIQKIGDSWLDKNHTCILRVPSAIIREEHNILINPNHEDFNLVKLVKIEDFEFDSRLR